MKIAQYAVIRHCSYTSVHEESEVLHAAYVPNYRPTQVIAGQ